VSPTSEESRHTAFTAAYQMGAEGRALFLWLAGENLPAARTAAVLSLYLRWLRDRRFVFDLLDDLGREVRLPPIGRRGRILRFLGDISITIYINHPHDEEVIRRTSILWRRVLRRQLRLHQLLFLLRGPIVGHVQAIVAARTLRTALVSELGDPDEFFRQDPQQRRRFLRTVPLVHPDSELGSHEPRADLAALLNSPVVLHRVLAALVLAIHAVRQPGATAKFVEGIRDQLEPRGHLWAGLAYAVPLPGTPEAWIPHLESSTEYLAEAHRATFLGDADGLPADFDIGLLPLGLAYGKRGRGMPLLDAMLRRGLDGDRPLALRIIRGLAAVGVYYPYAAFDTLRPAFEHLDEPDVATACVDTLAAMRALHFDAVDLFLQQVGAADELRERVSRHEASGLVSRCVHLVGYYSNAVHQALHYPIMRRALLIDALESLGRAHRPADFIRAHTPTLVQLLEKSEFELIRWTRPDAAG
jgi:hypothetical protein